MKILLVDDDEDEYILIKDMFSRLPNHPGDRFELHWVSSSQMALEACGRELFDVFLVDYHLGNVTGLDLMHAMESMGCSAPFILLTGQGSYELDLAAMEQGAMDYLVKDQVNEYLLERSIRYAIERYEAQAELERRVTERTREIAEKNQALEREIELRIQAERALYQAKDLLEQRVIERTGDLQAANQRMQTVLSSLPVSLVIADREERIVEYNQAYLRLWEMEGKLPRTLEDLYQLPAWCSSTGDLMKIGDWPLAGAIRTGKATFNLMIDIQTGAGNFRTILNSAVPIVDADEQIAGGVAVSQDITVQRRLEQQAKAAVNEALQHAEELEGLHKATNALLSTLDMDDLLGQILDAAQGAIPAAEKSVLHLIAPVTGDTSNHPSRVFADERIRHVNPADINSVVTHSLIEQRPLIFDDVQMEGIPVDESDESDAPRAIIVAPLTFGTEFMGTLSLISSQASVFSQNDLRLLVSFAATTTAALQNAILHAEVKHLAVSDPLTGQLNRRAFFERGEREIERFHRFSHKLAAVMIDLDRFKEVNDVYGHTTGDQVLRILAARVRHMIRESDLFGRYGGDEFALLMPDTDIDLAMRIARRILVDVSQTPWMTTAGPLSISISIGLAMASKRHKNLEDLIADADQALYTAKTNGRNRLEKAVE
jgi:diguanylate cyclase (GGDEF)-like protein